MRTLLVDNYDSFTYNLFHRIAEVNGREPEVVRNDDPAWRPGLLKGFDNVLLSPGQGTPFETARSGICAEVTAHGRLPVLGVGLGHQAIALAHGGSVGRAPWPCHGRTSPVRHTGSGLFHGLPNPLEVVRYHSLAVTGLSPALEPAAWATDDGVVMALRHCALPCGACSSTPSPPAPRRALICWPTSVTSPSGTAVYEPFCRCTLPCPPERRAGPRAAAGRPSGDANCGCC